MSAHYENDGGPLIIGSNRNRMRFYPEECWAPPESIWIGTAQSAPIEVEIVDRPPDVRTIRLPTRIDLCCANPDSLEFIALEDSSSVRTVLINVRPGYHVGWRTWQAIYLEDVEEAWEPSKPPEDPEVLSESGVRYWSARSMGRGTESGWERRVPRGKFTLSRIADFLERGTKYRIRRKIVAFETSAPARGHWSPESGDYRELAEQILEASWTKGSICPDPSFTPADSSLR
jgi:hypothetical protein